MSYIKKLQRLLEAAKGDEFGAGIDDEPEFDPYAGMRGVGSNTARPVTSGKPVTRLNAVPSQGNPAAAQQAQVDATKKAETDALAATVTGQPTPQQTTPELTTLSDPARLKKGQFRPEQDAPELTTLINVPRAKTAKTKVADTRLERMKALRASQAKPGFLSRAANFAGAMMRKGAPLAKGAIQTGIKKGGEFLDKKGDQTAYGRVAGGAIGALAGGPLGAFAGQAIGGGLQNLASGMRKVYNQRQANIAADPTVANKTKGMLGMFRGWGQPLKQNIGQIGKGAYETMLGALGARGIADSAPAAGPSVLKAAVRSAPRFAGGDSGRAVGD